MKKISLFLAIFLFSGIANAEIITSKSLYNFAKSRDYAALQKFSRLINVVNNGDTAVCLAIKNNDVEAYKLLLRYGANSRPECYSYAIKYRKAVLNGKPIPAISSKGSGFLGMSTTGWAITGGALAVGGVAAAAGGGGGGGSGGDEESGESSNEGVVEDFVKNCINGKQEGGECICDDGWTGALCNRPAVCPYNTISCKEGYEKTGKVCKSGETLYQECMPVKVPDGYTIIPCGDGYKIQDEMKSGSNTYYLCERETCSDKGYKIDCGPGYDASPSCVEGTTQYYQCTPTNCSEKGYVTSCATGMEKEQKCLSGTTPYYQCILPEGYREQECTGGYVQDGNSINYNGQTYYKCKERDCSAHQTSCGVGYDATQSCLSGTTPYYTCTPKQVPDGYTTTECTGGYVQDGETFMSGETNYYKCKERDCSAYQTSCGVGYDATQSCLSGTTQYYTCTPKQVPDGYTFTEPCNTDGYNQIGEPFVSGENTYYKCEPKDCSGYTTSCEEGYDKGNPKCYSGETPYYQCTPINCSEKGYVTSCATGMEKEQKCLSGTTPYYQCILPEGYSEQECTGGYVQDGNSINYNGQTYYKCEERDCSAHQTSCGVGYDATQSCLSGTTPYYTCTPKQVPDGYTTTECTGGYVQDGETFISGETNYYKCKERDCSAYQTSCGVGYDATQSCLSGTTPYYTCTPKQVPDGYTSTPCGKGTATFDTILSGETRYYKCVSCGSIDEFGNCLLTFDDGIEYAVNGETINTTDIIGIEAEKSVKNAYHDGVNKRDGTIQIENNIENSDIYGIKSTEIVYNNYEGGVGSINIRSSNSSNGIYGIYSDKDVYNVNGGDRAVIIINNSNTPMYFIHGIYSGADVYNNNGGKEAIIEINNNVSDLFYSGHIRGIDADNNIYYNNSDGVAGININNESYIREGNTFEEDIYAITSGKNVYYNRLNGTSYIDIKNKGKNFIYGVHSFSNIYIESGYNIINIDNDGLGDVYAVYADNQINFNGDYNTPSTSIIRISNDNKASTGNVYGINGYSIYANNDNNTSISIVNQGQGDTYGVYGSTINVDEANIEIANVGDGTAYGGYTNTDSSVYFSSINIHNLGLGTAIGIYGYDTSITGQSNMNMIDVDSIIIDRENYTDNKLTEDTEDDVTYEASNEYGGTAIGIYINKHLWASQNIEEITITGAETGIGIYIETEGRVTNNGTINVFAENAFGIYMKSGISISGIIEIQNTGTINVSGENAYGIYVEDGTGVTVSNSGTIIVNGSECTGTCNGTSANGNYIVLNGAPLYNSGTMSARSINLDRMGGTIIATESSSFEAEDDISGNLTMSSDIVTTGFDDVYTTTNTINAGDTSNLNLLSQSALFDASLAENNSDVNLKMKQFNEVVDNKSLADFLQNNYAMKNNETFFNTLKKQETVVSLNDTLSDLTGQKLFSRFADEDLMMMRELTFDMNNRLFMNEEDHLETSGNISTFNFNGNSGSNSRYALINQDYGSYKLGLNYGFADVRSYDNNDDNRREEMMFHMGMPISYHKKGFKFITTPHVGYASGTYDRKGLNRENYDGHIEKTMFGLMNEARYPIVFDKWTIAPSAEFNVVNYATKGHEKGGTNPLNLDLQHNYSVEAGLGLYANTEHKFGQNAKLSFTGGVAMYHEFADPYKLSIGMEGMSGKFDIRDENRSNNRAVIRTGLKFTNDNLSLDANVMSYIDREYRTNATLDFKYNF